MSAEVLTRPAPSCSTGDRDVVHVLNERLSPAERSVWTMWCGEQCVAFDDASLAPEDFDFYLEAEADKASCAGCRAAFAAAGGAP